MTKHRPVKVGLLTKIVFLYIVIAVVFIGTSYVYYAFTINYLKNEIEYYADFITKQFCDNFQITISNIELDVFGRYNLNVLLGKNGSKEIASGVNAYYKNVIRDLNIKNALDEMLYLVSDIKWVSFVDMHGNVYSSTKNYGGVKYDILKNREKDLADTAALRGRIMWRKCNDGSIMLMRIIYDMSVMRYCGYAIVNLNADSLTAKFADNNNLKNGDFVVFDSDSQPMLYSSKSILKAANYYMGLDNKSDDKNITFKYAGKTYICTERKLDKSKLAIIHLVDIGTINKKFANISKILIIICITCLLIVLAIIILIFAGLTRNVKKLVLGLGKVAEGDLTTKIAIDTSDEIGYISQNVDVMVLKITNLLKRISYEKKAKQEARYQMLEFRYNALQEQINPHFLFNVLESINGIAKLNNDKEVSNLVCKLAKLLRGNLGRAERYCTLKEEMEYIENYLSLYKEIYRDKLIINYQVDGRLNNFIVPTFILQPVVENSIVHGIEPKMTIGTITITAVLSGDNIILNVSDDGMGIPEDKLKQIMAGNETAGSRRRVGLLNVRERIKLLYGPDYGLKVSSVYGKCTSVEIVLPQKSLDEKRGEIYDV
jgi:two-component system sensor histidine kinase YesM